MYEMQVLVMPSSDKITVYSQEMGGIIPQTGYYLVLNSEIQSYIDQGLLVKHSGTETAPLVVSDGDDNSKKLEVPNG